MGCDGQFGWPIIGEMWLRVLKLCFVLVVAATLSAGPAQQIYNVGDGVTAPRVVSKTDPGYTREAREAQIQGTALYGLIVDPTGHPRDIRVVSPIGFGLDETGEESIAKWVFEPGLKDGVPVSVRAQIEVSFRFAGMPFDKKRDARRTAYNLAMDDLRNHRQQAKTVATIEQLAEEGFPPAIYLLGSWHLRGEFVAPDAPKGLALIRKAADHNVAAALFELGTLYEKGNHVPADPDGGFVMIRQASILGSVAAQFEMGSRFESGVGLNPDRERARHYFRLCAAVGLGPCQFHLGRLLLPGETGGYSDPVQASAWLELAAENHVPEARIPALHAAAQLSPEQLLQMKRLKAQLLRRPQ
jgi:TonB family protein